VWGRDGETVPASVLMVSAKRGGILLGATAAGDAELAGFVWSMPGVRNDGIRTHWSHMLAVRPSYREHRLGERLKWEQRTRALVQGAELIEWTFDPLQALNAHLNFSRLGVVVESYEENVYGDSSSPLHRGTPTDRFIAEWHLTRPHVERRITAPLVVMRDAGVALAPVVNPSMAGDRWLRPGAPDLALDAPRLLVEIPTGFTEMQASDAALALDWRLSTRAALGHYLSRGYRVVDFFLSREHGRGQYLLTLVKAG